MQSVLTRFAPSPLSKYLAPADRSAERLLMTPVMAAASRALLSDEPPPVKPLVFYRVEATACSGALQQAITRFQVRVNCFTPAGPATLQYEGGVGAGHAVPAAALPLDALGASRAARLALLFQSLEPDLHALNLLVHECGGSSMDPRILAVALAAARLPEEAQPIDLVSRALAQALGQDDAALALLSKAEVWLHRVLEDGPRRLTAMHGLAFTFAHLRKASQGAIDGFVEGKHASRSARTQHLVSDCYLAAMYMVNKHADSALRLVFDRRELTADLDGATSLLGRLKLSHEPTLSAVGRVFAENLKYLSPADAGRFARQVAERAAKCSFGKPQETRSKVLEALLPRAATGPGAPSADQVASIIQGLLPGAPSREIAMEEMRSRHCTSVFAEEPEVDGRRQAGMARALFTHAFSLAEPTLRKAALSELVRAYCRDEQDISVLAAEFCEPTPAARIAKDLHQALQSPRKVNKYVPPTVVPHAADKDGK